jgi:hypothetical protein
VGNQAGKRPSAAAGLDASDVEKKMKAHDVVGEEDEEEGEAPEAVLVEQKDVMVEQLAPDDEDIEAPGQETDIAAGF